MDSHFFLASSYGVELIPSLLYARNMLMRSDNVNGNG